MKSGRAGWALALTAFALLLVPVVTATTVDAEGEIQQVTGDAQSVLLPFVEWAGHIADGDADPATGGDPAAGGVSAAQGAARYVDARTHATADAAQQEVDALLITVDAGLQEAVGLVESQIVRPVQDTAGSLQRDVDAVIQPAAEEPAEESQPQMAASTAFEFSTPMLVAAASAATAGALVLFWLAGSSSGMGSAGAGAGSRFIGQDLRRLLPVASPLFTRFEKDTVLGHPKREALYALIIQTPGITLQDLCDATNLSRTAVTHHLRLLELQHIIVSRRLGRSRHFYENGGRYGRDQKDAYAVLQNDRSRDVARFIQEHPGAIQKHICQAMGIQASVAHWHVRRLQEAHIIDAIRQGRTVSYFPLQGVPQTSEA